MWVPVLMALAGCSATGKLSPVPFHGVSGGYGVNEIIDTESGRSVGREGMMERLANARVIYVGEVHTSVEDHRVQLEILRELHRANPSLTLAVEMIPRRYQHILDRYAEGELSEEGFLDEVRWRETWGYPFLLYRDLFLFARNNGLRIVGLNAPGDVVRRVARGGLASLSAEDRAELAETFHLDDERHRRVLREEYAGHMKEVIRDFDTFFEAQLAWEETMAETLARLLDTTNPGNQVVVLIGKGHIRGAVGVPDLTSRRVPHSYATIAPIALDYPGTAADPDLARMVWITDGGEKPNRRKLGVMLRPAEAGRGLEVMRVLPDTPAFRAGIRTGDVIVELDGTPLREVGEIGAILERGKDKYRVDVLREGVPISIELRMGGPDKGNARNPRD